MDFYVVAVAVDLQLVLLGRRLLLLFALLGGLRIGNLAVGIQELDKVLQSPVQVVVDDLVVILAEVLDGWEGRDLDALQLVGSGVHLGNHNVSVVLVLLGELFVDGSQLLAVTAPWSIELNQHRLALVQGNRLEVGGDEHLDGLLIPILGQLLRQQMLLQFAIEELLQEGFNGLGRQIIRFGLVLGHILLQLDETNGGNFLLVHAEEFEDAGVVLLIGRDGNKQNIFTILLGDLLQWVNMGLDVSGLLGDEEQQMRFDGATEDLGSRLMVEVNNQRQRLHLGEFLKALLGQLTLEHGFLLIERLEENDTVLGGFVLGNNIGVAAHTKDKRVQRVSGLGEDLGLLGLGILEETDDGNLIVLQELFGLINAGQVLGWWASLLGHPGNYIGSLTSTAVLHGGAAAEELQCGVSTDLVLLGELTLNGGIDLGKLDGRLLGGQLLGSLGVLGCQSLAVSAPWSVCNELKRNNYLKLLYCAEVHPQIIMQSYYSKS